MYVNRNVLYLVSNGSMNLWSSSVHSSLTQIAQKKKKLEKMKN